MRTLTLGVLIVTIGTLAALPFRRYQAVDDASSGPAQATGPELSIIDQTPQAPSVLTTAQPALADLSPSYQPWTPPQGRLRRDPSAPLTYQDLAVPIETPQRIRERFSATSKHRRQPKPSVGSVMPRMETLAVAQQHDSPDANQIPTQQTGAQQTPSENTQSADDIQDADVVHLAEEDLPVAEEKRTAEKTVPANDRPASLASVRSHPRARDATVVAQPSARKRHWIRQPD